MHTISKKLSGAVLALALLAPVAVMAETVNVTGSVRVDAKGKTQSGTVNKAKERANEEIARRIENLTKFSTEISKMKHISTDDQSALKTTLDTQISSLTALQAKIAADEATSTLRSDIQSISKSYRIYALVIPQSAILAAADRILEIAAQMEKLNTRLSERVKANGSTGNLTAMLSDFNAKIADAKVQANAAIALVLDLKPDNGDEAILKSNMSALKDAKVKVQLGQKDLQAAREDARKIVMTVAGPAKAGKPTDTVPMSAP